MTLESIPFDFGRLVSDTLRTHTLRAQQGGLELALDLDPDIPRHLIGDPGRFRQILTNLVGNAIKFTRAGEIVVCARLVCIDTRVASQIARLQITVSDTGIGIPQDKQRLIFEAFEQEDGSTTRRFGGTGLGLSITKRLVNMMNGEISVTSEVGRGSTFVVTVGVGVDRHSKDGIVEIMPISLSGRTIMLVDDNNTNLTILSKMFERWTVATIVQHSGNDALAYCRSQVHPIDCIIMDYIMPGLNGFETASALSGIEHYKDVPIVILSSSGIPGDAEKCRELGIQGYLLKPASHDEIHSAVCGVINRHRNEAGEAPIITRHSIREAAPSLSILLVEDNRLNQQLALALLKKWGHRVKLANNGIEALEMHQSQVFDLILMDLQMPLMGGVEATAKIREREKLGARRTVVIAMTANALEGDREKCIADGMDDYLSKPFKAEMFSNMLKKYSPYETVQPRPLESESAGTLPPQRLNLAEDYVDGFDYAGAIKNSDTEVVRLIAAHFLVNVPQQIATMRHAWKTSDFDALQREAHALAGLLGNFMAEPAQRLAAEIDHGIRENRASHIADLFDALEREIALLAPHLADAARLAP